MRRLGLLALFFLLALFSFPSIVKQAHAAGTLYVSPYQVAQKPVGSSFQVKIKVASIDPFNAWDIQVHVDPRVLNATSLNIYPNLFSKNYTNIRPDQYYEAVHCTNGVGSGCSNSTDGPGVVHSAMTLLVGPPQTGASSGLLFTITYQVIGTKGYSGVGIENDIIANGGTISKVQYTSVDGVYGIPTDPDFSIASNPSSAEVAQGSFENLTITLSSIGPFSGIVYLSAKTNITGLTPVPAQTSLKVKLYGSNSTSLRISAGIAVPAGPPYFINITCWSGTLLKHTRYVSTIVARPGSIEVGLGSSQLLIHAGDSAQSAVTVSSVIGPFEFSGPVSLRADVTSDISPVAQVQIGLSGSRLQLSPGGVNSTTLTVQIPPSYGRFMYKVTVYANGTLTSSSQYLNVFPPPGDLRITFPSTVTVEAGSSADAMVNIASLDYLYGAVNLAASMSNGAVHLNTTTFVIPPDFHPRNFNVTLNVAIEGSTPSGNYNLTLTVYTLCFTPGGQANNCASPTQDSLRYPENIAISVTGGPGITGPTQSPTILGLEPPVYFGILGVFAFVFVVLAVQTYRKSRE